MSELPRFARAAHLVQRGAVFALNWDMELPDPPLFGRQPFRHEIAGPEAGIWNDDVLHHWNTQSSSQWDGFRHVRNLQADERTAVRNDPARMHEVFTHSWFLSMLGLPLREMWNLEPLAADSAADGRYECFLTSSPLNLLSGVASPPNALAMK